ncbi:MAG: hypothetical protein ACRD2E_12535 [Terriglobales bacterium]
MYEDFHAGDPLTGREYHCLFQCLITGIATRHSDTVDVKFLVNGAPMWLGLPHPAWIEFRQRSGHSITDRMAVDLAGLYLKQTIESGMGVDRQHWNDVTVADLMRLCEEQRWLTGERPAPRPAPSATPL